MSIEPGPDARPGAVEHVVAVDGGADGGGYDLWVRESGDRSGSTVLLVMGAASSGVLWPDRLVERLGRRHRVVVWDHRDTGRSTRGIDDRPYAIRDLAGDAVAVLDALAVDRAHVVGMSMGGYLVQLLLLDHPDRLLSATLFCTGALPGAPGADAVPGPSDELLAVWATLGEPRDAAAELDWRVEHWRVLNGGGVPFDAEEFRALEERVVAHGGPPDAASATAHARAGTDGLARGAELAGVTTPVLVVEAPADPAYPPPSAAHLARTIGSAHRVEVPGMGHALPGAVLGPLGDALSAHLDAVDGADAGSVPGRTGGAGR
ncbi:alpha/beta hydrolase [Nocardioides dongxiaopingii]|uniref:alpha/beta fold hydrolase n=1 Tax=Nocardioides sp. S-1144 TaxID=2582905 RepID=UPI00110E8DA7|nr:alpha/beta hydrolase [Nocardioides sp. S-1144]QCW51140.1 alpha/beta hydrolase [Nocardioides sp. S-1144]